MSFFSREFPLNGTPLASAPKSDLRKRIFDVISEGKVRHIRAADWKAKLNEA
jgi:hypothetical protein